MRIASRVAAMAAQPADPVSGSMGCSPRRTGRFGRRRHQPPSPPVLPNPDSSCVVIHRPQQRRVLELTGIADLCVMEAMTIRSHGLIQPTLGIDLWCRIQNVLGIGTPADRGTEGGEGQESTDGGEYDRELAAFLLDAYVSRQGGEHLVEL